MKCTLPLKYLLVLKLVHLARLFIFQLTNNARSARRLENKQYIIKHYLLLRYPLKCASAVMASAHFMAMSIWNMPVKVNHMVMGNPPSRIK